MGRQHFYNQGRAVFAYDMFVKKSIYDFKYRNKRRNAVYYGNAIYEALGDYIYRLAPDVFIPVPIHEKRLKKRGYNQAELIASQMEMKFGIKCDCNILIRTKMTKPQKELTDVQRHQNIENAFKITENVVKYKKVLLVDDIYTTGSTIDACAKELICAGAAEVDFVSLSIGDSV